MSASDNSSSENPRARVAGMFLNSVMNIDLEKPDDESQAKPAAKPDEQAAKSGGDSKPDNGKPTPKPTDQNKEADAGAAAPEGDKPDGEEGDPKPTAPDLNSIAMAAAEGAARGTKLALEESKKTKEAEENPDEDYPPQYADDAEVLATLEQSNPKKYSGLKKRLIEADKAEVAYRQEWQKENPGKKFDPDSDEHADFYAGINVAVDPRDLKVAERKLIEDKAKQTAIETIRKEERARQSAESLKRIPSMAQSALLGAIAEAAREASNIEVDPSKPETINAIDDTDPLLSRVIVATAAPYRDDIAAAIAIDEGVTQYDPKNQSHARIASVTLGIHKQIMAQPESKRVQIIGGVKRRYVPPNEFVQLPEDQRQFTWTITAADVVSVLQNNAKRQIVENYKAWLEAASKRGGDTKTTQSQNPAGGSKSSSGAGRTSSTSTSTTSGSGPAVDGGVLHGNASKSPQGLFLRSVMNL